MSPDIRHSIERFDPKDALSRGFFVIAFFACFMLLCVNPQLMGGPSTIRVSQDEDFGQGWKTLSGEPANLADLAATAGWTQEGITITNHLPKHIEHGVEFNFLSANCTLRVYFDGELIYAFEPDPAEYGVAYAPHFNYAPLSETDAEKLVSIEIAPAHADSLVKLLDLRLSGTSAYIQRFVRRHIVDLCVSATVAFIGLIIIVLHYSLRDYATSELDLLSLGALCVLLGIWSSAETLVPQLITGLGTQIRALDYLALLFIPYPMCRFMGSLVRPRHQKLFERIILVLTIASVTATMVLGLCFGIDLHQTHIISRTQLLVLAIMLFIQVKSSFEERGHRLIRGLQEANRAILVAFLILIVASLVDFVFYRSLFFNTVDAAIIMRYSLFAFSLVLAIEAFRMTLAFLKRANRFEDIEAVAYVDALTGIGNRTAWVIMRNEIDEALKDGYVEDALVCAFDVNFLKRVNDTYGHAAGDSHLKRAADTINRSFGTEGACYRTGGDEFTCLLVGINLGERLDICEKMLLDSIQEQNDSGEGEERLSMAMGFAYVSESSKHTIDSANTLADKRMYAHKRAMKAERTD